jgi:hypothetical protein
MKESFALQRNTKSMRITQLMLQAREFSAVKMARHLCDRLMKELSLAVVSKHPVCMIFMRRFTSLAARRLEKNKASVLTPYFLKSMVNQQSGH